MRILKYLGIGAFILIINHNAFSQSLTCDEAVVLNSIEELDGITGFMFSENPNDEPAPFCSGSEGGTGNPQNMNWFAFMANTTDATIEITFSNCLGNGNAIQYGLYTDCTFNEYHSGVCQGDAVLVGPPVVIHFEDLTEGEDYYFFIDGDIGTHCDFVFEVTCIDGIATLPQPSGLECVTDNCPLDEVICTTGETLTFKLSGLDLEIDYFWTVLASPINGDTISGDTIYGNNEFSATFDDPGMYEICAVGNNGCAETSPICYHLNVVEPNAGSLVAEPDTLCIEEESMVYSMDFFCRESLGSINDISRARWQSD